MTGPRHISIRKAALFVIGALIVSASIPAVQLAPNWRYAADHTLKVSGMILVSDELGPHWDDRLPDGWAWLRGSGKPGRYYFDLGRLSPSSPGGRVVFEASRWNFVNMALQSGFSEEATQRKLEELARKGDVRFKEDREMAEARSEFSTMGTAEAQELLTDARTETEFSIGSKGAVVLTATAGGLWKLFVENYSTAGYITALAVQGAAQPIHLVKSLEWRWNADFDRDGLIDVEWQPISHIESSKFTVQRTYKIAAKIYAR